MIRILQAMPSRNRVFLNNVGLCDIDPAIRIHDVSYEAPGITTSTVERARYHGSRVTRQRMGDSRVTIQFEAREYDTVRRQDVINRIVAWAMKGGILTTDDRPNQRLHVVCTSAPSVQSTLSWTARQEIEFSAFDQPFWEDITPKTVTLTGTSGSGQLYGAGAAADPFVEVSVSASEAVTSLVLNAGNTTFTLSGISLSTGQGIEIGYDETHTLFIKKNGGISYLGKRTPSSDDDLMIPFGEFSTVSFTSDGAVTVVFKARGLYL